VSGECCQFFFVWCSALFSLPFNSAQCNLDSVQKERDAPKPKLKSFVATSRVGGDCCLCQKRLSSLSRPHHLWPSPSLSCRFRRPIPHRCSLCHPMCLRDCPPQTRIWCIQLSLSLSLSLSRFTSGVAISLSLDLFVAAASLLLLCALFARSLALSLSLSLSLAFPSLVFSGCSHYQ
jgi:hypothetical protein